MNTQTNTTHAASANPHHGNFITVSHIGRLVALLALASFAAAAQAGNPFSVDQHKNGITVRFQPLRLFQKQPKAKPADPVPQVALATNAASAVSRGAAVAVPSSSTISNTPAGSVNAGMTATAAPSSPQPTSPPAVADAQAQAPRLADEPLNRLAPSSLSELDLFTHQMQQTPWEAQAEYQRVWLRHLSARAGAQQQVQRYISDVAGDLGAMGIESR